MRFLAALHISDVTSLSAEKLYAVCRQEPVEMTLWTEHEPSDVRIALF